MRKTWVLILAAVLLLGLLAVPGMAVAEVPTGTPRIAVVRSAIADATRMPDGRVIGTQFTRVDRTVSWLTAEFGVENVAVIGDAELADVNALRAYDVVVLVRQISMSAAQRLAVRDYVAGGGGVVAMFGLGRWDYVPTRRPAYIASISLFPSLAWEWGESSELYGVSFYNDPLTAASYHVVGRDPSLHPILQMTADELGRPAPLDLAPNRADYNEYVRILPGAAVTPLATYANAPCSGTPTNGSGWLAGWSSQYESGRFVYYGFQLYDVISMNSASDTGNQGKALFLNSVRWAGTADTYSRITHSPRLAQTVRLSGRTFKVSQSVSAGPGAPLRGQFGLTIFDPSGRVRYRRTNSAWKMMSVGQSVRGPSWSVGVGRVQRGRWVVRTTFKYWEYARGGWATGYRDAAVRVTRAR
jgi:hypothetical protein